MHKKILVLMLSIGLAFFLYNCGSDKDEVMITDFDYRVPVKKTAPWPQFRRTSKNTGITDAAPREVGRSPWAFKTGKGIFSTPIVDSDDTIYCGSADNNFYALNSDGSLKWVFETEGLVDSAGIIRADNTITFPSADGRIYTLGPDGSLKWSFQSTRTAQFISWWEGNVTMDEDGTLYSGNDDFFFYAINSDGTEKWAFETTNNIWSAASIGDDGTIYFASLDMKVYALNKDGSLKWSQSILGPIAASPALGPDGTVYVGGFDGFMHAYEGQTGTHKWSYPARDHIYASAAVDEQGNIFFGSTDGSFYSLTKDGQMRWIYDTMDPIRSSAAIGGDGTIFFGCGDGRVYALNSDGSRRWSFDTSTNDRNDVNASPGLGFSGLFIAGESTEIYHIPYGYCETHRLDQRVNLSPQEDLPADGDLVYYTSPGGTTTELIEEPVGLSDTLTFRLIVRHNGETVDAAIMPASITVDVYPLFDLNFEISGNGEFINIVPIGFMAPDTDYSVTVQGDYKTGGTRFGNKVIGGTRAGSFNRTFNFTTDTMWGDLNLSASGDQTFALDVTRLSVYQPSMLPSLNQIGFDDETYMGGVAFNNQANGTFIMWFISGAEVNGEIIADPVRNIAFPVYGARQGNYLTLLNSGFSQEVFNVTIPFNQFRIAVNLQQDWTAKDGARLYAETRCSDIEYFGALLQFAGICNEANDKLIAVGKSKCKLNTGPSTRIPANVTVDSIRRYDHNVNVVFTAPGYQAHEHMVTVLLMRIADEMLYPIDFKSNTEVRVDGNGDLQEAVLRIPQDIDIFPRTSKVFVMLDASMVKEQVLF